MKKDNTKQRLAEVMNRLDKTFKLNEGWWKDNEDIYDNNEYKTNKFPNIYDKYKEFSEYFIEGKSKVEDFEDGNTTITYVFNIPKSEYTDSMYEEMSNEFGGSSHGVEGNAGGIVTRVSVHGPIDIGDYMEIAIVEEDILDV